MQTVQAYCKHLRVQHVIGLPARFPPEAIELMVGVVEHALSEALDAAADEPATSGPG